jgi:ATP-dependent Clp protease protease subunit
MGAGYRFKAKADKTAEVQIYEDVGAGWFGGVTAKDFASDLKSAGVVAQIDVRIASYGGDVNEGLAIYRMLAEHDARVVVHIDGVAASIASVIAMAGDEIVIAEAGSIMIHEAWNIAAGHADDFREMAVNLEKTSGQLADIYAARTKKPTSMIKDWMKATTWFYGQEAVDAGFANAVAENVKAAASASMWSSYMQSRISTHMNGRRIDGEQQPQRHPANDDVRAALESVTERLRHRALQRSRGAGA